jgi:hypothetical protein
MSVLTYLTETQITDAAAEIQGKTLTRPALLATDGNVLIYVVDVDIGAQPIGMTSSTFKTVTTDDPVVGATTTVTTVTQVINGTTVTTVTSVITDPPAAPITNVTVTKNAATSSQNTPTILRDVPIARNNRELVFADAGAAVTLRRSANGRYEIVGLSNELPGTYTVFTLDLGTFAFGPVIDLTLAARPLTLGELSSLGSFGVTPLGAVGLFRGGVLQEITS